MATNSVKANLAKEDIISEISLSINADINHEKVFLIVEGSDDICFWKYIAGKNVVLFESFSGKVGISEIIQNNFVSNPNVIGIRDRDYETSDIHPKVFYYDYSCLEMMLINCDSAFDSICSEYYFEECEPNEIRINLLKQLKLLSLFRKHNEINQWGINLKGIKIADIFDRKTKKLPIDKTLKEITRVNGDYFISNGDKIAFIENEIKKMLDYNELLDITQGHDFLRLFCAFCVRKKGRASSVESVAASLRCAYRDSEFKSTYLYQTLTEYAEQYSRKITS